jgi:carbonic anhydrase
MKLSDNLPLINFLNDLFDANMSFAANHDDVFFDSFRDDQTPRVTILTCSDSRVQMESFDESPQNDIFAIRNIGNQVDTCEGSIDFGVRVLKTPFLLIIGHSGCGAVQAVLSGKSTNIKAIDDELKSLKLSETDMKLAIVENVNNQVNYAINKYQDLIDAGKLTIVGAIYDFKNDFGFGKGKIIALSINNEKNGQSIRAEIAQKVKNFKFLNLH